MADYTDRDRLLCAAFFALPVQELIVGPETRKIWPAATFDGLKHLADVGIVDRLGPFHWKATETSVELADEFLGFDDARQKAARLTILDDPEKVKKS